MPNRNTMSRNDKPAWLVPASLLVLSTVPAIAGIARLIQLNSGGEITALNARFLSAPLPVVLHILSAIAYSTLGAFQFSSSLRSNNPGWHRQAGRVLIPIGLTASFTGLWMSMFYPTASENFDGPALQVMRLVVSTAMTVAIGLGLRAIWLGRVKEHQMWMMRAYALGLGAGTQVLTHVPWMLFPEIRGETTRAVCMGAGWVINVAVAEWLMTRRSSNPLASAAPPEEQALFAESRIQQ